MSRFQRPSAAFALVAFACSVACMVFVWRAGRDLNWDLLNYHLYAAYQFADARLQKDFMAASVQGYLNPVAYLPFYWMVMAGWPSLAIGMALALVHSACLWFVYAIASELIRPQALLRPFLLGCALVLAALSPIFLVELGTTFIDVSTAVLVLAGLWLLLRWVRTRGCWLLVVAGLVLGMAAGLKLTNAVFAVTAGVFLFASPLSSRSLLSRLSQFATGGTLGFVLTNGFWAHALYREFGNPFFPFFNGWFRSPDFPPYNMHVVRFAARSWRDFLDLPLRIADVTALAYAEFWSADIRPLVALVICVAVGFVFLRARAKRIESATNRRCVVDSEPLLLSLLFVFIAFCGWALTSSIGRYGLPLFLFIGPAIVAGAAVLSRNRRVLVYGLLAVIGGQSVLTLTGDYRYDGKPWSEAWIRLEMPPNLRSQPSLFLSLGLQTPSFLAPFLHRDSSFVNLVGQYSLGPQRAGWDRVLGLVARHKGSVRTLVAVSPPSADGQWRETYFRRQDTALMPMGGRIEPAGCQVIVVQDRINSEITYQFTSAERTVTQESGPSHFMSCPIEFSPQVQVDPRLRTVDAAFTILETRCSQALSDRDVVTTLWDRSFTRYYQGADVFLMTMDDEIYSMVWRRPMQGLGTIEQILKNEREFVCPEFGPAR